MELLPMHVDHIIFRRKKKRKKKGEIMLVLCCQKDVKKDKAE